MRDVSKQDTYKEIITGVAITTIVLSCAVIYLIGYTSVSVYKLIKKNHDK